MNNVQTRRINEQIQTVLLGTLTPSPENQPKDITTGLDFDERSSLSDKAVAQWLADLSYEQGPQAAVDSFPTSHTYNNSFSESDQLGPKFRATVPNLTRKPQELFIASQRWEGIVLAIHDDVFEARLVSLQGEQKGEQFAEIYIDEVDAPDRPLLKVGAIFYWTIGYLRKTNGNTLRASILRFRRMPTLSEEIIAQAAVLVEEWGQLFSDAE